MAKPICVVNFDNRKRGFTEIDKVQEILDARLKDYHVLVVPFQQSSNDDYCPIRLQVFYEKDFNLVKYEELKSIICKATETMSKK